MADGKINPAIMEKLYAGPIRIAELYESFGLEGVQETMEGLKEMGVKITEAAGYVILEKADEVTPGESPGTSPASPGTGVASPPPRTDSPAEAPATEDPEPPAELPAELRAAHYFTAVDIKVRPRKGALPKLELIPADSTAGDIALKLSEGLTEGRALAVGIRLAQVNEDGGLAPLEAEREPGIAEAGTGAEGTGTAPGAQVPAVAAPEPSAAENEPSAASIPAPQTAAAGPAPAGKEKPKEKTPDELKRELAGQTSTGELSPGLAAGMSGLLEG